MPDSVVAIDLGGTWFRVARFIPGKVEPDMVVRQPTDLSRGLDSLIDRIAYGVTEVSGMSPSNIVSVSAPGPLDPWRGVVYAAPNMVGWPGEVPLRDRLADRLHQRVIVGNDANLAAIGEHLAGAGRGAAHLVYLTISTGIGAGIIVDSRLMLGAHGLSGEIGHTTVDPTGPRCGCGNIGCLELFSSGTAIGRIATDRLAAGEPSSLSGVVTADQVAAAAQDGDPLARDVFATAGHYLGVAIVTLLHLYDPDRVVLGGGVTQAGPLIFDPVHAVVADRAMPRYRSIPVVPAALGDDAGLIGASAVGWRELAYS